MSFDPARLLGWQVPDVEQALTRRDTAFYALSTGFGADPLDPDVLRFVDPKHDDLVASPSMALVLGYPGFWLGDPALGLDAARVLHLDQAIRIERPLPVEGRIVGKTKLTRLIDRGEGRGALLLSERDLSDEAGVFARLSQTYLFRSEGGFASAPGVVPDRHRVPDRAPDRTAAFVLPEDAALFYRLNGDFNPLHSDPRVAERAGFRRPIMHGMGTFGFVVRELVRIAGGDPHRLTAIAMRFSAPAFPGDRLTLQLWDDAAFAVTTADGRKVIDDGRFTLR